MFRLIPCETLDELGKLVGDMLGNGSDEFLGGIYLEVLPVFAFSHPSLVDDFVRCFYKVDLLDVEDVTYDVPSNVKLWSKPLRKANCFNRVFGKIYHICQAPTFWSSFWGKIRIGWA